MVHLNVKLNKLGSPAKVNPERMKRKQMQSHFQKAILLFINIIYDMDNHLLVTIVAYIERNVVEFFHDTI